LNLLNGKWKYAGDNDYSGLFRQLDVTAESDLLTVKVPAWLEGARETLLGPMPTIVTGQQCTTPYDCPFQRYSEKHHPPGPQHPLDLLPDSSGKALARKLRETKGYTSLLDPSPEEFSSKNEDLYRRMQEAHRTERAILNGNGASRLHS